MTLYAYSTIAHYIGIVVVMQVILLVTGHGQQPLIIMIQRTGIHQCQYNFTL